MMRHIIRIYAFLLVAVFFGCNSQKQEFDGTVSISGEIQNAPEGKVVLLQIADDRSEEVVSLDLSSGGKFEYELTLEGPGFYELNLMDKTIVRLALYAEDVKITYDFSDEESLQISGSKDSQHLQEIEKLSLSYQESINELNNAYFEAMSKRDQNTIMSIQDMAINLENTHSEKVKSAIDKMDGSFAAMAALPMLNPKNDFQYLDGLITKLDERYPNTKLIQAVKVQLDDMRMLSIGQIAPEIALPNPNEELTKLSDLRGKYVLIDFWAAWCRPCREENPNVVRLYNEYKDKGFEVFGVSLDRTKEAWVKAIADDNLTWSHVSDLKYFNSEAAALYKINAIPATYLLDPEGKIIAKDLRGKSLEDKLKEIFG
jgi:peroxiredoxin